MMLHADGTFDLACSRGLVFARCRTPHARRTAQQVVMRLIQQGKQSAVGEAGARLFVRFRSYPQDKAALQPRFARRRTRGLIRYAGVATSGHGFGLGVGDHALRRWLRGPLEETLQSSLG